MKKIDLQTAEKILTDIQKEIDKYNELAYLEQNIKQSLKHKVIAMELKQMKESLSDRIDHEKQEVDW